MYISYVVNIVFYDTCANDRYGGYMGINISFLNVTQKGYMGLQN